MNSRHWNIFES